MSITKGFAGPALLLMMSAISACGQADAQAPASSKNQLCGTYSLSFSGVLQTNPVGYIAGAGQFTSDCHGNLSGAETTNVGGVVCQNTASGTYTLSSDGTGTDSITLTPTSSSANCTSVTFTESIAVGDNGKVVQAINSGNTQVTTYEQWMRQ